MPGKHHTLSGVRQAFADAGCELLATEYVNTSTPMPYICECGRKAKISFGNFQQGRRCKPCGYEKMKATQQHSLAYVQQLFADAGCELLATEYVGAHTPMPYICECGCKAKISFGNFKYRGQRCEACGNEKIAAAKRHSLAYVQQFFADAGCELLTPEYVSAHTPMPYICECGRKAKISFGNFQQGRRCKPCGYEKKLRTRRLHNELFDNANFSHLTKELKKRRRSLAKN